MSNYPWGQDNSNSQQQHLAQQYAYGQQQQAYIYQQQINENRAKQHEQLFEAICKFVLYENGIPKERQEKYVSKCAMFLLGKYQEGNEMSDINMLILMKEFVPTIKFEDEMTELLDGEEK